MPDLPNPSYPDTKKHLEFLEQYRDRFDARSIIIGHSMGAFLAMHFVAKLGRNIDKLICVAPVFDGLKNIADNMSSWDFAKSENQKIGWDSMDSHYDLSDIQKNTNFMKVFLSGNDPWISFEEAKKHFISTDVESIPNAGHFCDRDGYSRFDALLDTIVPSIRVYTTRVDTVYGMTYAVLAPDHPSV